MKFIGLLVGLVMGVACDRVQDIPLMQTKLSDANFPQKFGSAYELLPVEEFLSWKFRVAPREFSKFLFLILEVSAPDRSAFVWSPENSKLQIGTETFMADNVELRPEDFRSYFEGVEFTIAPTAKIFGVQSCSAKCLGVFRFSSEALSKTKDSKSAKETIFFPGRFEYGAKSNEPQLALGF